MRKSLAFVVLGLIVFSPNLSGCKKARRVKSAIVNLSGEQSESSESNDSNSSESSSESSKSSSESTTTESSDAQSEGVDVSSFLGTWKGEGVWQFKIPGKLKMRAPDNAQEITLTIKESDASDADLYVVIDDDQPLPAHVEGDKFTVAKEESREIVKELAKGLEESFRNEGNIIEVVPAGLLIEGSLLDSGMLHFVMRIRFKLLRGDLEEKFEMKLEADMSRIS
ncbi:MAG: hypothetical protein RML92_07065 [Bacteroidia bacterium]|nr:hypothetical protein [Bacteroidia bacterium]